MDTGDAPLSMFTDDETRAAWNAAADAWDDLVESGKDYYRDRVHGPALLRACEPVEGRRVLDLGCGQGYFTRALARAGAHVVGVDISDQLVDRARSHEQAAPLGIEYQVANATTLALLWPEPAFDLVTACMSLQDMADVPGTFGNVASVLVPTGRFIFSVPHPTTNTRFREWERDETGEKIALRIDGYFDTGPDECHWNMPRLKYHWTSPYWRFTLDGWSNLIANAGFIIRRMAEPRPTNDQVEEDPNLDDCHRLPYFLVYDLARR